MSQMRNIHLFSCFCIFPVIQSAVQQDIFLKLHGDSKISNVSPKETYIGTSKLKCAALCGVKECQGYNLRNVINGKGKCEILIAASQLGDIQTELNSLYYERLNHRFCADRSLCYIYGFQATYYKARTMCTHLGARMIDVYSSAENQAYRNLASSLGQDGFWIGLRRPDWGGRYDFYWEHSGAAETYTNWDLGQPYEGATSDNCVSSGGGGKWSDVTCYHEYMYICAI